MHRAFKRYPPHTTFWKNEERKRIKQNEKKEKNEKKNLNQYTPSVHTSMC